MLFSLIIPTYNNLPELQACLSAVEKLSGAEFQVLVCVDGSTDGTVEWLETAELACQYRILTHADGKNHGRSAARNLALPHLSGDFVLFLDSDMIPDEDLLKRHLEVLKVENSISLGWVRYRNLDSNVWVRYLSERGICKFSHGEVVPFNYFITPNTALPAHWLRELGGFDANINRYGGEDMELGYRIRQHFQPRFVFNERAVVETIQEKVLSQALKELKEYGATGLRYITRKYPELKSIYWVEKCDSKKIGDRIFEALTGKVFQGMAKGALRILPYFLQKQLINYLVVSAVHEGYREAGKS